jgi:hypothetical protein
MFAVNLTLVRFYLRHSGASTGQDVLNDAFRSFEMGAWQLVAFCLELRGNRRTRRSMTVTMMQWRRQRAGAPVPAWYTTLANNVLATFRQWHRMAFPREPARADDTLTHHLPRNLRRRLAATGMVQVELPTLHQRAKDAFRETWALLAQGTAVLWLDNWYMERYGVDPAQPRQSLDVTALAVLPLSTTADPVAFGTRHHRVPPFRGHLSLLHMVVRVDTVDSAIRRSLVRLVSKVRTLATMSLTGSDIRVPLDVRRGARRTLQWRPFAISEDRVSANVELLRILGDALTVQSHMGGSMPLLVDEKVHYTVCRLMYSPGMRTRDVAGWLGQVPLLYGAWHPYKQSVTLVYRQFFPLFAVLECVGQPPTTGEVRCYRKLLYMEKVCAALLLAAHDLRPHVEAALHQATRTTVGEGIPCREIKGYTGPARPSTILTPPAFVQACLPLTLIPTPSHTTPLTSTELCTNVSHLRHVSQTTS